MTIREGHFKQKHSSKHPPDPPSTNIKQLAAVRASLLYFVLISSFTHAELIIGTSASLTTSCLKEKKA